MTYFCADFATNFYLKESQRPEGPPIFYMTDLNAGLKRYERDRDRENGDRERKRKREREEIE